MPRLTELMPLLWLLMAAPVVVAVLFTLVDRPRGKMIASAALRVLAIALLVFALARPVSPASSRKLHVAFLVDVSASVDLDGALAALDRVDDAVGRLRDEDSWALALVGAELMRIDEVEAARERIERWRDFGGDDEFRAGSDLVGALDLTRLSLPSDRSSRVVLFTDAKATGGGAVGEAIERLGREGVGLRLAETRGLAKTEACVVSLSASPAYAYEGELCRLTAEVMGNTDVSAEARLVHRGVVVSRRQVELRAGEPTRVEFTAPMVTPGTSLWRVEISADSDHFAVNNSAACTIEVRGRPRVLVVHTEPREMRAFERAMEQQDLVVETRPPRGLPRRFDELLSFDAVLLADAPATEFSPQQLEMLRTYVSDFAGGLAMLGSEESFGLGGYYRTPVEDALPLVSRFEKEKEEPSMAMALVIDRSGSMTGTPLALARQAAKAAVELIGPRDQIAVVAFDDQAFVVSEMAYGSEKESIKARIDRIGAGGGTFMFAGMRSAADELVNAMAQIKHMIVLGDGMTQGADHDGLVRMLVDRGVTVSTVALGPGADQALMSRLAELGRGRYYQTADPSNVPQIFTRETVQASKSAIKEDLFASVKVGDHPLLEGVPEGGLPFTLGFVMTRAKPTAQVLLATETGDPLLAVNNYGLGATLAYTSDLTSRWGAEWLAWDRFGSFWAQAIRSILRRPDAGDVQVDQEVEGDWVRVGVTAMAGGAPDGAASGWVLETVSDAGRSREHPVRQVGIGRYEARVPLGSGQRTTLRLHDRVSDTLRVIHHHRGYPREYNLAAEADAALAALPRFDSAAVRDGVASKRVHRRLAPWLLLLACVCFTGGVLLRRI